MKRALCILLVFLFMAGACAEPAQVDGREVYADQGGVRVFSENKQVGLMDADGNVLLEAAYDEIEPFRGGDYALVRKGELSGVVGRDGRLALDCEWDHYFSVVIPELRAARVCKDFNYHYLIDLDTGETLLEGNFIIGVEGNYIYALHYGYYDPFELWGPFRTDLYDFDMNPVMSLEGNLVEQAAFGWVTAAGNDWSGLGDYTLRDPEGKAIVRGVGDYTLSKDGGAYYVRYNHNLFGRTLEALGFKKKRVWNILRHYFGMDDDAARETARQLMDDWNTCGILRPDGTRAEVQGDEILPPKDGSGLFAVRVGNGYKDEPDRWGYVDGDMQWVVPPVYAGAWPFVDGTAAVQDASGKLTLIDAGGRALPVTWESPTRADLPVIAAAMDGGLRLIDRQGRFVTDEVFSLESFRPKASSIMGPWSVYDDRWLLLVDGEGRLCPVDMAGHVTCRVPAIEWESGFVADGGRALWVKTEEGYGLLTIEGPDAGTWRIGPAYEYIYTAFGRDEEDVFSVMRPDGAWCYVAADGRVLGVEYNLY